MIGTRALASTLAATCLAMALGPRIADPASEIAAERLVSERAELALRALDDLQSALEPGLDAGRRASASTVAGDDDPGPSLVAAGETIAAADPQATAARDAVALLNGARRAWRPGAEAVPEPIALGALPSIGDQLGAAAPAATDFVDLRRRSIGLPEALERAVIALEQGDVDAAEEIAAHARADHDRIGAWEAAPTAMQVWLATTDAMIGAVERIVAATRAGDSAEATAAAQAFAELADEAVSADRALRIGLSEGGAAVTSVPLERLAAELRRIQAARAEVAVIVEDPAR